MHLHSVTGPAVPAWAVQFATIAAALGAVAAVARIDSSLVWLAGGSSRRSSISAAWPRRSSFGAACVDSGPRHASDRRRDKIG